MARRRKSASQRTPDTPAHDTPTHDTPARAPDTAGDDAARVIPDPDRPGTWLVRVGASEQSHVDPDHPEALEFDYMQRIAEAIDHHAPPGQRLRVIHIGGAGMSLARYVAATRPTSAQIVLEPDTALTAQVRAKVPLPRRSGIKVRPVDGRSGIAAMQADYADIIILDAFNEAQVPGDLVAVEFLADVARVLRPGGLFLGNITDKGPLEWARRAAASVVRTWPQAAVSAEPSTWRGRRFGNLILYGSTAPIPVYALARSASAATFAYRVVTGAKLNQWLTNISPFTEADARPSPRPPELFLT